jgi:hypothetical protein
MSGRSWTLTHTGERAWTLNTERRWSPFERARRTSSWRQAFAVLSAVRGIPQLDRIRVTAWPMLASRRGLCDTGAVFPSVKAAVDGLRDAGVVEDDGPDRVVELTMRAPVVGDVDGLVVVVEELD